MPRLRPSRTNSSPHSNSPATAAWAGADFRPPDRHALRNRHPEGRGGGPAAEPYTQRELAANDPKTQV